MAKAKTDSNDTVVIDTETGTVEVPRSARILVVKMATIPGADGDAVPHDYATTITDRSYELVPLDLEAGATLVNAGTWADHVAASSPGLSTLLDAGALTVYPSAASALSSMPAGQLRKVLAVTRHGVVLREWESIEQSSEAPRRAILQAIRERLRLFADHAPLTHIAPSVLRRRRPATRMPAEVRG